MMSKKKRDGKEDLRVVEESYEKRWVYGVMRHWIDLAEASEKEVEAVWDKMRGIIQRCAKLIREKTSRLEMHAKRANDCEARAKAAEKRVEELEGLREASENEAQNKLHSHGPEDYGPGLD